MKTLWSFGAGMAFGILVSVAFMVNHDRAHGVEFQALRDSTAIALGSRAAAVETVTVHQPAIDRAVNASEVAGQLVTIIDASTIAVRVTPTSAPVLEKVPEQVTAKMRADSIAIAELRAQNARLQVVVREDSNVIRLQARQISVLEKRNRCGSRCWFVIGVLTTGGAAVVVDRVGQALQP